MHEPRDFRERVAQAAGGGGGVRAALQAKAHALREVLGPDLLAERVRAAVAVVVIVLVVLVILVVSFRFFSVPAVVLSEAGSNREQKEDVCVCTYVCLYVCRSMFAWNISMQCSAETAAVGLCGVTADGNQPAFVS